MRALQVLLQLLQVLLLLQVLQVLLGSGTGAAHLGQPQVNLESPLEPKAPAQVGPGQHTWARRRRHSPHFPICSFCCNCCNNRGCGLCCRT